MDASIQEARAELERFATLWGLDRLTRANEDDRLTNGELLSMYLACSVVYVPWSRVYKAMPWLPLSFDQLMQSSRKTGSGLDGAAADKSRFFHSRQAAVVAQLFNGACFTDKAKQTTLYEELEAALAPAEFHSESLKVRLPQAEPCV